MKNFTKLLALALAFVGAGVGTAQAQVLVTSTEITSASDVKTVLPDGSYVYFVWTGITDNSYGNGSTKYYFNGASAKNTGDAPVAANYFKVIYDDGATTFKLQRATDGQYVTVASSGAPRTVSMSSTGGSSFSLKALTKSGDMTDSWADKLSKDADNYAKYMRLVYTEDSTEYYINCQNKADAAKFHTGKGAYSICKMYRVPGTVTLNSANDKYYATGYYPVNMTVGEGTAAYYGAITEGTDGGKVVQMTAYTDNIIPANQGALLVSESSSTATLTPTTSSSSVTGNCLEGTSVGITADAASNYYVFGYDANSGVGFYHPKSTSLAAFKAYIPASSLSSENVQGLALNFDGQATSISAVETETNTNAPIYDLSGRRVVKATKGLYIQDGKKVYLK